MAQNRTYAQLLDGIEALAGVDAFTTAEQTRILANVNRRIYQAYRASELWPRYLIRAQARPAPDGIIPLTYDASAGIRTGSAESRSGTTVTIVCTAAVDFVEGMEVTISGLSGTVNPNGTYAVTGISTTTVTDDTFTYELVTTNTGSETYSGTATVTPVTIPEIDSYIRVWDGNPNSTNYAAEYDFTVTPDGAEVQNNFREKEGFWVMFKKKWAGPYLSSATDIPQEFFEFAVHAAYADFLRMEGQTDRAMAEEQFASAILSLELQKAEVSQNAMSFRRIQTHASRQSR